MRAIIAIVATVTVITILALHPPVDRGRASWQISLKIKRFAHEWILKLRGLICRADDSSTAFSIFFTRVCGRVQPTLHSCARVPPQGARYFQTDARSSAAENRIRIAGSGSKAL